jgi:hypothetical protein
MVLKNIDPILEAYHHARGKQQRVAGAREMVKRIIQRAEDNVVVWERIKSIVRGVQSKTSADEDDS